MSARWMNVATGLLLFLLPWQTRWIYDGVPIEGSATEFGTLSLYATQVVLVVLLVASGAPRLKQAHRQWLRFGFWLIPVFFLALPFATSKLLLFQQALFVSLALGLCILLLDERLDWKWVFSGLTCGLVLSALIGLWQVVTGSSPASTYLGLAARDVAQLGEAVTGFFGDRTLRAYGTFPHPNILGGYLAVTMVALAILYRQAQQTHRRWLLVLFSFFGIGLFLTFSQAAWLGAALGVTMLVLPRWFSLATAQKVALWGTALAVLGVFSLMLFMAQASPNDGSISFEERSSVERVDMYSEYGAVMQYPTAWVVGHGAGNYVFALAEVFPGREWWRYQPMHNAFLLIIAEIGLLGLGVVLLWMKRAAILVPWKRATSIEVLALPATLVFPFFFDHYLWTSWSGLVLVALVVSFTLRRASHEYHS